MFTILKSVDASLYFKFDDIEKNIASSSRTVYVSMQSFLERFFKYLVSEAKLNIPNLNKFGLGQLLGHDTIMRKVKLASHYQDFEFVKVINQLANDYKHGQAFMIHESQLMTLFQKICELIDHYLVSLDKPSDLIQPLEPYFQALLHRYDEKLINTYQQELIQKKDQENHQLLQEKHDLEIKLNILKTREKQAEDAQSLKSKLLEKIQEKQTHQANLKRTIRELEQKMDQFFLMLKAGTPDDAQQEEKKQTQKTLSDLDRELDALETELNDLQLNVNRDQQAIETKKYETLIEEQEQTIRVLQEKIALNQNQTNAIQQQKPVDITYQERSLYRDKIRNLYARVKFNSNYLEPQSFEITNLTLDHHCQSRFGGFYAVVFNILIRSETTAPLPSLMQLPLPRLQRIYAMQILLLGLIKEGVLRDDTWTIALHHPHLDHALLVEDLHFAYQGIFEMVDKLSSISMVTVNHPTLVIDQDAPQAVHFDFEQETLNHHHFGIMMDGVFAGLDQPPLWIDQYIPYAIKPKVSAHLETLLFFLNYLFDFKVFREGQVEILANFLNGRNTIGVLPTGAGKSLTYYYSVIMQPKIALVVAPILALMKDQNLKLTETFRLRYVTTISSQNEDNALRIRMFKEAKTMFTLVSPERLQNESFRQALIKLNEEASIGAIVLDEVHCLSEWGHDFRPSYLMLSTTLNMFAPHARYLGLTATASVNVVKDIMIELKIRDGRDIKFVKKLKRENLQFKIMRAKNEYGIAQYIEKLILENISEEDSPFNVTPRADLSNCGIIFCNTTSETKPTGTGGLYKSLLPYVGQQLGIFNGKSKLDQDAFMKNEKTLLIATKAFGMGIDKPNVRFTIHAGMPSSREGFYQEAGRAGRDQNPSMCYLISSGLSELDGGAESHYIDEFLNFRTSIPRLKEIAGLSGKELGYSDISTHFYFFSKEIDEPSTERDKLMKFYQHIDQAIQKESKDFKYKVDVDQEKKTEMEKLLYHLHKLGVVHNYAIQYRREGVTFQVDVHHLYRDINHLKAKQIEYLKLYDPNHRLIPEIQQYQSLLDLPLIIYRIRTWYHDTFTRARREQLANIHAFIKRHDRSSSAQIQDELEAFFDLSSYFKVDEEKTIEFSNQDNLKEIIEKVFLIPEEDLPRTIISTEFLIESIVNYRIDLYIALLHLRNGDSFQLDKNGKARFEFALSNMNEEEKGIVLTSLVKKYPSLYPQAKLSLLESMENEGIMMIKTITMQYPKDLIVNKVLIRNVNQTLNQVFKGETK